MKNTGRRYIWIFAGLVVILVGVYWISELIKFPPAAKSAEEPLPAAAQAGADDSELRPLTPEEIAQQAKPAPVVQPVSRPAETAANQPAARREPSPEIRQKVTSITQLLDPNQPQITAEQVAQWKEKFQDLVQQGAAAVPAIREFLEKNSEVNFKGLRGSEALGDLSLRSAFINALQQIGGPEAQSAMLEVLQTSLVPGEIALVARHLEEQAPGQYRQEALAAAREALSAAGKGELTSWDVAPVFRVMQEYGGAETVPTLEEAQSRWRYYATMALAGFADGHGIPTLVRQATDSSAGGGSRRDFAYQMLAQYGAANADAGAALLAQARQNAIPESAWKKIGEGLAGDQYQMGPLGPDGNPQPPGGVGMKTYHINSGNQNFYSYPLTSMTTQEELEQRRAFLDQLAAVTTSPAGVQALEKAKAALGELP